jgi:hypothetical protein
MNFNQMRKAYVTIVGNLSNILRLFVNTITAQHTSLIRYMVHVGIPTNNIALHQSNFKIMNNNRYGFLCISFLHHKISYYK